MGILSWLLLGLVAGMIAEWLVSSEGGDGLLGTIVVGVLGAVIGGLVYGFFGHAGVTGLDFHSIGCAIVGAVLLLVGMRALRGPRTVLP